LETEIARLGMEDYVSQVLVPTEKVVTVKEENSQRQSLFLGYVMIKLILLVKYLILISL
jgi:transcriptional antiterminator NusG